MMKSFSGYREEEKQDSFKLSRQPPKPFRFCLLPGRLLQPYACLHFPPKSCRADC